MSTPHHARWSFGILLGVLATVAAYGTVLIFGDPGYGLQLSITYGIGYCFGYVGGHNHRSKEEKSPEPIKFSDRFPEEGQWFVFVDPEDPLRWVVGWRDWYHIREENGPSYRHDDPQLTYWAPLPAVPKSGI